MRHLIVRNRCLIHLVNLRFVPLYSDAFWGYGGYTEGRDGGGNLLEDYGDGELLPYRCDVTREVAVGVLSVPGRSLLKQQNCVIGIS